MLYAPSMKKSPWAKLMMWSTPNSSANPEATSAIDEPTTRPFSTWRMIWFSIRQPLRDPTESPTPNPSPLRWRGEQERRLPLSIAVGRGPGGGASSSDLHAAEVPRRELVGARQLAGPQHAGQHPAIHRIQAA